METVSLSTPQKVSTECWDNKKYFCRAVNTKKLGNAGLSWSAPSVTNYSEFLYPWSLETDKQLTKNAIT